MLRNAVRSGNRGRSTLFCAVLDDGEVRCWGDNYAGAVGGHDPITYPRPVHVALAKPALAVSTDGWGHESSNTLACALPADGVSCWGSDHAFALGRGPDASGASLLPTPAPVYGLDAADQVAVTGWGSACARIGVSVLCWGGPWTKTEDGCSARAKRGACTRFLRITQVSARIDCNTPPD